MNYVKRFLISLILLWVLGFWYVFKFGQGSNNDKSNQDSYLDIEAESSVQNLKLQIRLKQLESDIKDLERKNQNNELLINNLQ